MPSRHIWDDPFLKKLYPGLKPGFFVDVTSRMFKSDNTMGRWLTFLFCSLALVACEKDIDIDLNDTEPALVVDGSIENGVPPTVVLSKSLDYFGAISTEILLSSFVRKANVSVTEGSKTYVLWEDSVKIADNIYFYFYSNDTLVGTINSSYQLKIEAGGKVYTASTTIPVITRRIDSLWSEKANIQDDSNLVRMMIKATDRPGFGDYVRYFTKTNSEPFYPGFNSVFDDQVIDGKTYTIPVDRGLNKNEDNSDTDLYFHKGDTATLKLCNIDKANFDFWRTFEFNFQSIGNPFSNPTKVINNVSNGALGYFGGYAAQYRTIIIPK